MRDSMASRSSKVVSFCASGAVLNAELAVSTPAAAGAAARNCCAVLGGAVLGGGAAGGAERKAFSRSSPSAALGTPVGALACTVASPLRATPSAPAALSVAVFAAGASRTAGAPPFSSTLDALAFSPVSVAECMLGAFRVCFETSAACRSDIAAGSSSTGRASTAPSGGVRCSSGSLTARDASDARAFSRLTRSCSYLSLLRSRSFCVCASSLLIFEALFRVASLIAWLIRLNRSCSVSRSVRMARSFISA
mmetsp:Transcript_59810/g.129659  ORF Transcript_59810/g.129659 Transcript_59810/m.129659 type:complete len:251 (-) Transcript_59810:1304-2056(-)